MASSSARRFPSEAVVVAAAAVAGVLVAVVADAPLATALLLVFAPPVAVSFAAARARRRDLLRCFLAAATPFVTQIPFSPTTALHGLALGLATTVALLALVRSLRLFAGTAAACSVAFFVCVLVGGSPFLFGLLPERWHADLAQPAMDASPICALLYSAGVDWLHKPYLYEHVPIGAYHPFRHPAWWRTALLWLLCGAAAAAPLLVVALLRRRARKNSDEAAEPPHKSSSVDRTGAPD